MGKDPRSTATKSRIEPTRRDVTKTALYTLPVILSMSATPAFAVRGSGVNGCPTGDPTCNDS